MHALHCADINQRPTTGIENSQYTLYSAAWKGCKTGILTPEAGTNFITIIRVWAGRNGGAGLYMWGHETAHVAVGVVSMGFPSAIEFEGFGNDLTASSIPQTHQKPEIHINSFRMVPLIALEEHYLAPSLCDSGDHGERLRNSFTPQVHEKLLDLGQKRLDDLDAGSIEVQVISHIPLPASTSEVSKANDSLYAAVKEHPNRFAAFALLDMDHPAEAAVELQRCIKDLGFVGALIGNTTSDGRFFDTPDFEAVFAKADELDVPIYLHPNYPSADQSQQLYAGPWDLRMETSLGGWCWGWHSMVGLHVLRLFASNLFEHFPNLKLIIGHSGEMLPFMLDRIYTISAHWPGAGSRSRGLREVWDSNIWVTTSGMFSMAPMSCLLQTTKRNRIMYSVDYPLAPHAAGIKFLMALKETDLVTEAEFQDIAYRTAARLLKLNVAF